MSNKKSKQHSYMVIVFTILTALSFCQAKTSWAREYVYGKSGITVPVSYLVDNIFRFNQEVKTITEASRFEIRPVSDENPDYSVLKVRPRMNEGVQSVTFILADGSLIKTQLVIKNQSNPSGDNVFDFKPKDELQSTNSDLSDKHEAVAVSELDLMRGMVLGNQVSGYEAESYSIPIQIGSPDLQATVVKVYRGHEMNGYIYLLKTESRSKYFQIDLRALAVGQPNLAIAAQVDRAVLGGDTEKERQTFLRIIAKPGASSRKIILPVAIKEEKAK